MDLIAAIERAEATTRMRIRSSRNVASAKTILRGIEAAKGPLPKGIRAQADAYAAEVLGSTSFAPWLHVYSAVAGEFREGWIPDNYYLAVVLPAIKGRYLLLSQSRSLQARLFEPGAFPDLGYIVRGRLLSASLETVASHEAFAELIFDGADRVVFKADASSRGAGVRVLDRAAFAREGANLSDGVVQPFIEQHPDLARFASGSVGTLRLTTVLEPDGRATARAAFLRFGRDAEDHVGSPSHIRVPLDVATGAFDATGYTGDWLELDRHPDSGVVFAGEVVPQFAAARELVERLHRGMPLVAAIGWDVAVDSAGAVRVLEWNGAHNDIRFSEATSGPCFRGLGWEHLAR